MTAQARAQVLREEKQIDRFPASRTAFGALSAAERSAIYLRSIRAMLLFFTILTIISLVVGFIFGIVLVGAVHSSLPH